MHDKLNFAQVSITFYFFTSKPYFITDSEVSNNGNNTKRHRHGIAGQMSYLKSLGFAYGGLLPHKKLTGGNTNSLFSTAVISGSSSAPNLREMFPNASSTAAIEEFGGVPPIRPLETLHNALSLRQLDAFLEQITATPLYKTPSSTPPRHPSTPLVTPTNSIHAVGCNLCSSSRPPPLKLQSPSNSLGWSGPPSLKSSSSGPSSPGISDPNSNSKENSEMSSSIVSSDGLMVDNMPHMFSTELDEDLSSVGILLNPNDQDIETIKFTNYFVNLQRSRYPIKCGSTSEVFSIPGKSNTDAFIVAEGGLKSNNDGVKTNVQMEILHQNNSTLSTEHQEYDSSDKQIGHKRHQLTAKYSLPDSSKVMDSNTKTRKFSFSNDNVRLKSRFTTTIVSEPNQPLDTIGNKHILKVLMQDSQVSSLSNFNMELAQNFDISDNKETKQDVN